MNDNKVIQYLIKVAFISVALLVYSSNLISKSKTAGTIKYNMEIVNAGEYSNSKSKNPFISSLL